MSDEPKTTKKTTPEKREIEVPVIDDVEPLEVTGLKLSVGPGGNPDYIPFGSEGHAFILNLRRAETGDHIVAKDRNGREWTLADVTAFPAGTTETYLKAVLAERIRILQTKPTIPPGAPDLWKPDGTVSGVTGVV